MWIKRKNIRTETLAQEENLVYLEKLGVWFSLLSGTLSYELIFRATTLLIHGQEMNLFLILPNSPPQSESLERET